MNPVTSELLPDGAPGAAAWVFRLFVAGEAPNSILALRNLKAFCAAHCGDAYRIDVVDVLLTPERAWAQGVIVTPMVVRLDPQPQVQIIGNLSDTSQVENVLLAPTLSHG